MRWNAGQIISCAAFGWSIGLGLAITPAEKHANPGQIMRKGAVSRKTSETAIDVSVDLDGSGKADVKTGVGFFDHMLATCAPTLLDLTVKAEGDLTSTTTTPSRTSGSCSARRSARRSATSGASPAMPTASSRWTRR